MPELGRAVVDEVASYNDLAKGGGGIREEVSTRELGHDPCFVSECDAKVGSSVEEAGNVPLSDDLPM